MAFKTILFLHSENDGASRYFVAGNFDQEQYDIIDWYNDPVRRAEYETAGLPSPSAFPTLVNTQTGVAVRLPNNMQDALATLTGQPTMADKVTQLTAQVELLSQTVQELLVGGGV